MSAPADRKRWFDELQDRAKYRPGQRSGTRLVLRKVGRDQADRLAASFMTPGRETRTSFNKKLYAISPPRTPMTC